MQAMRLIALNLALTYLVWSPPSILAVRRQTRSVIICDSVSIVKVALQLTVDLSVCNRYCKQTYFHREGIPSAKRHLFKSDLRQGSEKLDARKQLVQSESECCCLFEAPWPKFVEPHAIERELDEAALQRQRTGITKSHCAPLVITAKLSWRTKISYDTLCKYLSTRLPLTILETIDFAEAAAYLNLVRPKHPAIRVVLHQKHVKKIHKEEVSELKHVLFQYLLDDSYKPGVWFEYPGYKLDPIQFVRLMDARKLIKEALKSEPIARAFDEMAISRALVDIAAADSAIKDLSLRIYRIPTHLCEGNFDKYDDNLANYFKLPQVDCSSLSKTVHRITVYLSGLKSMLEALFEKLVYEHMSERYKPLRDLLLSKKVYENIIKVNCRQRN